MSPNTIVTTAEGRIVEFGDWLSKFIVAHPKASALISLGLGCIIGKLL